MAESLDEEQKNRQVSDTSIQSPTRMNTTQPSMQMTQSMDLVERQIDVSSSSSRYMSLQKRKDMNCCQLFFRDFPYSLFQQRRKDPNTKMHVLVGQQKLEHDFEEKFWDFDNNVIALVQKYHISQCRTVPSKILGGVLAFFSLLLSICFQLELWMVIILSLSMYQQDVPAHMLCHCMVLNIVITQGLKRLFMRRRPHDFQPPRAQKLVEMKKSGGSPSSMIVASTTFVYAIFSTDAWILHLEWINDVPVWAAALIALATYLVVSFAKVHLGQNYPSDCILSLPPTLVVITLFYFLQWADTWTDSCPSCEDANGNESFCYFDSPSLADKDPILLSRANFSVGVSNSLSSTIIALVAFLLFTVLSCYPVELWNKLPYFTPTLLSLYLFKNIMLCPCQGNDYRGVYSPLTLRSAPSFPSQYVLTFALLFFSYGSTWIVNNLLGNRTGNLLSYIIRCFFFVAILFQTLLTLVTVRLVLVDQETVELRSVQQN